MPVTRNPELSRLSASSTLYVVEIKSEDVEAGLNQLLDKVKEVYGGEGRVCQKTTLLRKPTGRFSITYTGPPRAVELVNQVLGSVKNMQSQGGPWSLTQRIQINVV